jgi:uncharacterized membrane protein (DUF4010 family)
VLPAVASILLPALALTVQVTVRHYRRAVRDGGDDDGRYRNPDDLRTAIGFGLLYAAVLVLAAWLGEYVGTRGVYGLAVASGLTDVDAITLSMLRLTSTGALAAIGAAVAIALAVGTNLVTKTVLVYVSGGRALGNGAAIGFALPLAGLAAGIAYGLLAK